MEEKLYTAGQVADMAGVSLRTIRFYDTKGLLKPVSYSDAGYRLYNRNSILLLQKIIMLKYLGFSLQQIAEMIKVEDDMESQIAMQKELLIHKMKHLENLIDTMEVLENSKQEDKWDVLIHLLNLMSEDEKIQEQYATSTNLQKRINIHDYSTNDERFMYWVFRNMSLKPGAKILELGCGTGNLWSENITKLPQGIHLILTDRSEGMLQQTKATLTPFKDILKEKDITIEYQVIDANRLVLQKRMYDYIIANHMLYHVNEREACLRAVSMALKPGGTFYCTTIGARHMDELDAIVAEFDSRIDTPFGLITSRFLLENGEEQLAPHFSDITRTDYISDLKINRADPIYNYIQSYPGNAAYILEQRGSELRQMLEERIKREGFIYIHKSTGMFICKK